MIKALLVAEPFKTRVCPPNFSVAGKELAAILLEKNKRMKDKPIHVKVLCNARLLFIYHCIVN